MDTQVAWGPRGFLHAVAPVHSEDLALAFLKTMTAQGCRVERLTETEHRARFLLPARTPAEPSPPPVQVHEVPDVGAELIHPLLGRVTVTHHVTLPDGERLAVALGRGGNGIVREWAPVPVAVPEVSELPPVPAPLPAYQSVRTEMPRLF